MAFKRARKIIYLFALSKLSTIDMLFYAKGEYIIRLQLSTKQDLKTLFSSLREKMIGVIMVIDCYRMIC